MELSKQQKAGTLIAALALVALGVDKLFLGGGGPATASAQSVAMEAPVVTQTAARAPLAAQADSLALRLDQFAAAEAIDPGVNVPDLFSQSQWTLRGVFGEGERGGVKIGDELIHVGGEYDGATLISVSREGATFRKAGQEFFVVLERPKLAGQRQNARTPDSQSRD